MTHSTIMTYTIGTVLGLACLGGAVALALSPASPAFAIGEEPAQVVTNTKAKADRMETRSSALDPVEVRCVSRAGSSTCTGWPVGPSFQISGL